MDQSKVDPNFTTYFNTPKIRTKFSLGSTEISDDFSFNVSARYHNSLLLGVIIFGALVRFQQHGYLMLQ